MHSLSDNAAYLPAAHQSQRCLLSVPAWAGAGAGGCPWPAVSHFIEQVSSAALMVPYHPPVPVGSHSQECRSLAAVLCVGQSTHALFPSQEYVPLAHNTHAPLPLLGTLFPAGQCLEQVPTVGLLMVPRQLLAVVQSQLSLFGLGEELAGQFTHVFMSPFEYLPAPHPTQLSRGEGAEERVFWGCPSPGPHFLLHCPPPSGPALNGALMVPRYPS